VRCAYRCTRVSACVAPGGNDDNAAVDDPVDLVVVDDEEDEDDNSGAVVAAVAEGHCVDDDTEDNDAGFVCGHTDRSTVTNFRRKWSRRLSEACLFTPTAQTCVGRVRSLDEDDRGRFVSFR